MIAHGCTGQTTASSAFNALRPMTTLGDIIYGGTSGAGTRLVGNTTSGKQYLSQTGNGSASAAPAWASIAEADVTNLATRRSPSDLGLQAWNFMPEIANSGSALATGTVYIVKVKVSAAFTVANIILDISGAGTSLSNCYVGIYNSSGTLLGSSSDQSSSWQSTGAKTIAITVQGGQSLALSTSTAYYAAIVANNTSGTQPSIARSASIPAVNLNDSAGSYHYSTIASFHLEVPQLLGFTEGEILPQSK